MRRLSTLLAALSDWFASLSDLCEQWSIRCDPASQAALREYEANPDAPGMLWERFKHEFWLD